MSTQTRQLVKLVKVGIAVSALLVASAGAALAVRGVDGAAQARPFQYAATFHVTAPLDGAVIDVPWPTFGLGRVSFHSTCNASTESEEGVPYVSVGATKLAVQNESSTDRIGLAGALADEFMWLQPKGTAGDNFGMAGEIVNLGQPDGAGGTLGIAILDAAGTTASGTFAWSGSYDAENSVGRCTFTLQLKG